LLTSELTIKSIKYLLDNQALNKEITFQYLSTNFDGKRRMLNEVIKKVLENPYGCIKQFLQQQYLSTKINKQSTQKIANDK
jgi:hypothetical protein